MIFRFFLEADPAICNLGRCPGCGWWFEVGELVDDAGDLVGCQDCRGLVVGSSIRGQLTKRKKMYAKD